MNKKMNYNNGCYNYLKNIFFWKNHSDYYKIENITYSFSFIFNIVKLEYHIGLYNIYNNLILPSDLSLYNNLSLICDFELKLIDLKIQSIANIYKNKYFKCTEFIKINERANLGFTIYNSKNISDSHSVNLFTEKIINYNIKNKLERIFDSFLIIDNYLSLIQKINNRRINQNFRLKASFIKYPLTTLKKNINFNENMWTFENLYNNYFCFCKGKNCLKDKIPQKCKFFLYQYIIDNNRYIYNKTDYLFIDFIFAELSSDDVYPVFEEMERKKYPVHYVTENYNIYKKYCKNIIECITIILCDKDKYHNYGDFIEKYFSLFLKLKAVISGKYINIHYISTLFYNIEYITYIAVGHGVCYFKEYLYKDDRLYGRKKNDKILIPNSDKIISIAKKYGWEEPNIIKISLPRWDKYKIDNELHSFSKNKEIFKSNSIFVMFSWRDMRRNKKISHFYIDNIKNLICNNKLNRQLKRNNIFLYFSLHRYIIEKYTNIHTYFLKKNKQILYIEQNQISQCLSKTSLIVTDFSSIIFDLMIRKKPFVLYIPDSEDPNLKDIYTFDYYDLILSLKNNSIIFENIFFTIKETVNKIIYYINHNFNLDTKMTNFYKSFHLNNGNNIITFINYLKDLK